MLNAMSGLADTVRCLIVTCGSVEKYIMLCNLLSLWQDWLLHVRQYNQKGSAYGQLANYTQHTPCSTFWPYHSLLSQITFSLFEGNTKFNIKTSFLACLQCVYAPLIGAQSMAVLLWRHIEYYYLPLNQRGR